MLASLVDILATRLPEVLRWSGAISKRLRHYNIAVGGKDSGSAMTDALTLADLTVQELIVAALRDFDPLLHQCRIEAEESTGDLLRFAAASDYVLTIDPIDGTKQYRDKTGNGYANMVMLQSRETVHYSLVFIPEQGEHGTWVEVRGDRIVCGADDPSRSARAVLDELTPITRENRPADSRKIYMIGFQQHDRARAADVTKAGLEGYVSDDMPGCIFELFARGEFGGSLIHSPNIYDFPASMHIARALGGDAVWVDTREPVNFHELWLDEGANMLRLPRIVACGATPQVINTLCNTAANWNPIRYAE